MEAVGRCTPPGLQASKAAMSIGTAIAKKVLLKVEMVKLERFVAAASFSAFASAAFHTDRPPFQITHTKMTAMMGAGAANIRSVNQEMAALVSTFLAGDLLVFFCKTVPDDF